MYNRTLAINKDIVSQNSIYHKNFCDKDSQPKIKKYLLAKTQLFHLHVFLDKFPDSSYKICFELTALVKVVILKGNMRTDKNNNIYLAVFLQYGIWLKF